MKNDIFDSQPDIAQAKATQDVLTILLVDDNEDLMESLAIILTHWGHRVHKAATGEDALRMATEVVPDLTIMDIGLPDLYGYDVCERMRKLSWSQGKIIIALSAWGSSSVISKALSSGFDKYFTKPIDLPSLEEILSFTSLSLVKHRQAD